MLVDKLKIDMTGRLQTLEAQAAQQPQVIKDSLFQRELLTRVQKLEERSLEQILQLERIHQKQNETELRKSKGKQPTNPVDETTEAIGKAMKRIEQLEKQDLTTLI